MLGVLMYRCLNDQTPQYLVDCRSPVSDVAGRQRLPLSQSSSTRCTGSVRSAFAVIGLTVWNSLSDDLRAQRDCFMLLLKTLLFTQY